MTNGIFSMDNICKVLLKLYICALFACYEIRVFIEVALIGVLLLHLATRGKLYTVYALWSLAFLSICVVSNLWSIALSASLVGTRSFLEVAVIGNLLIAYLDRVERLEYLMRCYVVAGWALVVRLLIVTPTSVWGIDRAGDAQYNANAIGLQLAISVIYALHIASSTRRKRYLVAILFFVLLIFMTGSRKALVFVLIGMASLRVLNREKITHKLLSGAVAALSITLVFYAVMRVPAFYKVMGSRLEGLLPLLTGQGIVDASTRIRLAMKERAIHFFITRPGFGHGINTFSEMSGYGTYAHNNYLELLVGVGVVGTFIYYFIYLYAIVNLLRAKKTRIDSLMITIIVLLAVTEYGQVTWFSEVYHILIVSAIAFVRLEKQVNFSTAILPLHLMSE